MKTQVLIIGGGVTGTGLARDLAMRGVHCIVVEKRDINAGASGGNHGLLHSGARYVGSDPEAAVECREEGRLLKQLAPHCIENTGGLFIAVKGDDPRYIADFPGMCERCGIPCRRLDPVEARELEPELSENVIAAYQVEDATVDPFKLSLDNMAHAQRLGAVLLRDTRVTAFERQGSRIRTVRLIDTRTGRAISIEADQIVNASGAWAGNVAALAGATIKMVYSKGSMLVTQNRVTGRVINRLRQASDADIIVPGGTVSILGTTSVRVESPDVIYPEIDEVDRIIDDSAAVVPSLATTRYIRAYCGVRPLVRPECEADDRCASRGFTLRKHENAGLENFVSITGGKLTTYRLMAEKTADIVCRRLGVSEPCRTRTDPLPSSVDAKWTEPGLAPSLWMKKGNPNDILLCDCEMVPQSTVDSIVDSIQKQNGPAALTAIGLRSRIGKGPCQGTFCSQRVAAYLYDRRTLNAGQGIGELRGFLRERWRGQRPLLWDTSLIQSELQEAMHCGLFGLDLPSSLPTEKDR